MLRRSVMLAAALAVAAPLVARGVVAAETKPAVFKIGYQKIGILVVAPNQRSIERRLEKEGIPVQWVEFSSGPPLLEAMNAGAIDLGLTGDTPPIFAQAGSAAITYVAALPPNGPGEAIVVKSDSAIKSLADLAGKRVGFKKGSSANNLVVAGLEKAGVPWTSITPFDLSPADGAAAFDRGSIDAWAIWDPFFAVAEERYTPRVLATSADVLNANTFLLANPGFAAAHPALVREAVASLSEAAAWAQSHPDEVAEALHAVTKVDLVALKRAAARAEFYVRPISDEIVRNQQATADRFHALGLLPKRIVIRDAVWNPAQS